MLSFIKRQLSRNVRVKKAARVVYELIQRGVWFILDTGETLLGRKDPLTPPRR